MSPHRERAWLSGVAMQRNAWDVDTLQESLSSKVLAVYLRRDRPERAGFLRISPIPSTEIQDLDIKICLGTRVHVLRMAVFAHSQF